MALKRSGFGPRKTPMSRGSRKSSPSADIRIAPDKFTTSVPVKRIRSRPKRPTVAEGSKYLAACRGEPCYLNACCPWTDWADPTVVDCHSNQSKHGKSGALKAKHEFTVPGCSKCHYWLDFGPAPWEEKCAVFDDALERWKHRRARKMGGQFNAVTSAAKAA